MMKQTILLFALLGVAFGQFRNQQPVRSSRQATQDDVRIVRSERDDREDGSYNYLWETSDGSQAEQTGYVKNLINEETGVEGPNIVMKGSYQYYDPEGQLIKISYIADENGFQPIGDHLPTPPPVPEAIQRALEIIYRNADMQRAAASNQAPVRAHRPSNNRRF